MKKSNNWIYLAGFVLMCIILVIMILFLPTFAAVDPEESYICHTCENWWNADDYCFDCNNCINHCTCGPHTHSFGSWYVVTAATCTATGQSRRDCNCGYYELMVTPKKSHNYVDCVCTMCNDVSHSWSDAIIQPTCTTDGHHRQICDNCGTEQLGDTIPATGHTYVSGSCSVCGASDPNYDPCANGHNYVDCVCTRCNDVSHSWRDAIIQPTCTADGSHRQICDNCGTEQLGDTIPALGHDFVNAVCSRCGTSDPDHVCTYGDRVVLSERTCVTDYHAYAVCTVCGLKTSFDIPAYGHDWINETVIQEGGCLEDRIISHTCSRCGLVENVVTPPAFSGGHVYIEISREEVTANLVIIKEQCLNCKEIKERVLANEAGQGEIISNWAVVFVDGVFDGLLDSYDILANGISVGGVSLSNVVTSFFMVLLLIIIVAIIAGVVL